MDTTIIIQSFVLEEGHLLKSILGRTKGFCFMHQKAAKLRGGHSTHTERGAKGSGS